jgi:hypothetical protein
MKSEKPPDMLAAVNIIAPMICTETTSLTQINYEVNKNTVKSRHAYHISNSKKPNKAS